MAMSTPDAPISEVPAISEEEVETHFTISIFFSSKRHVLVWVFLSCFWGKFFFIAGPWPSLNEEEESPKVADPTVELPQVAVPVPVELPTAAVPVEPTTAAVPVEPPTAADPTGEPQDFLTTYFQQATCEHGLPECACLFFWKSTRLSALFFSARCFTKGQKTICNPMFHLPKK